MYYQDKNKVIQQGYLLLTLCQSSSLGGTPVPPPPLLLPPEGDPPPPIQTPLALPKRLPGPTSAGGIKHKTERRRRGGWIEASSSVRPSVVGFITGGLLTTNAGFSFCFSRAVYGVVCRGRKRAEMLK